MGGTELTVLVVDDDFRVANMHAGIVNALPGFTVTTTATTLAAAHKADPVDLALVDVYLPDGSGIDFVRELRCDSMVLSAATDAPTIRAAIAAGALSYLVKPFAPTDLVARLSGYARYRKILAGTNLGGNEVDAAMDALRPRIAPPQSPTAVASPTKQLVLQALRASGSRCRRLSYPRRSACRGPPRNGICRRWPIPAMSKSSSATARPDDPNRNSWPSTSRPTALRADVTRTCRGRPLTTALRCGRGDHSPVRGCHGIMPQRLAHGRFTRTHQGLKTIRPTDFSVCCTTRGPGRWSKCAKGEDRPLRGL